MPEIFPISPEDAQLSNEEILREYSEAKLPRKIRLYPVMAARAHQNEEIRDLLFEAILDPYNRETKAIGFAKLSWLPVLSLLDHASPQIKFGIKDLLQAWDEEERDLLRFYLKKEKDFSQYL